MTSGAITAAVERAQTVARWADPDDLRRIIEAAAPVLLAAERARIGLAIEAARTDRRDAADDALLSWRDGMEEAAQIARGSQPADSGGAS